MNNVSIPDNLLRPNQPVDVTNCEREPIHIPGRIQPHGFLLVLQEPQLTIVQASDNTAALFNLPAHELTGKPLDMLLQPSDLEALRDACEQHNLDNNPVYLLTMQTLGNETRFDAIVHRSQGVLILELEPAPHEAERQDTYALVRYAIPQIQSARSLTQMFDVVAQQVRRINGFDRVMVYQFDAEGHGSVVAESKRDELPALFGLRHSRAGASAVHAQPVAPHRRCQLHACRSRSYP